MVNPKNYKTKAAKEAATLVRKLRKPTGMSKTQWKSVRSLLIAIAHHYPTAVPSVARLAEMTGLTRRHVQRLIALSKAYSLLRVEYDEGRCQEGMRRINKTSRYHLTCVQEGDISEEEMSQEGSPTGTPTPLRSVGVPSGGTLPSVGCALDAEEEVTRETASEIISRREREVADRHGESRVPSRPRAPRGDWKGPAQRLAEYWFREYRELARERPRFAAWRPASSKGMVIGYVKSTLLPDHTEVEIQQMMDDFIASLISLDVQLKDGQPAFHAFTVRWQPTPKTESADDLKARKEALSARNK